MGVVGTYLSNDFRIYQRDDEVICRTQRGLEAGVVICSLEDVGDANDTAGELLRKVGAEDRLILDRLERFRDSAYQACQSLLAEHRCTAVLVDVEHLFGGESVYFYFLGQVDSQIEALTEQLAETYDRKVKFKKFAETLATGCGPTCGTGESSCGSGGCGSCALAGGCGAKSKT